MTADREAALLAEVPDGLFIGGVWRPASEGRTLRVFDPATGEDLESIS